MSIKNLKNTLVRTDILRAHIEDRTQHHADVTPTIIHNNTTLKQGGNGVDEYYHFSQNQHDNLFVAGIDNYDVLVVHANADFTDSSGKDQIVVLATATIDTVTKKFGAGSGKFVVVSSQDVYYADSSYFTLTDDDFTVSAWVRFDSVAAKQTIISHAQSGTNYWELYFDGTISKIGFKAVSNSVTIIDVTSSWTPVIDTWYFISACRNTTTFYIAVDGSQKALTGTQPSGSIADFTAYLVLGNRISIGTYLDGRLDDVRFAVGIARYTEDYIVPSVEVGKLDIGCYLRLVPVNNIYAGSGAGIIETATVEDNIAIGVNALAGLTAGCINNVAIGTHAGEAIDDDNNVFIGYKAGETNTYASNVIVGSNANLTGDCDSSVIIGYMAGIPLEYDRNVIIGREAAEADANGFDNVIIGNQAAHANIGSFGNFNDNIIIGSEAALTAVEIGQMNIIMMEDAGNSLNYGSGNDACYNILMGYSAGRDIVTGYGNVCIGYDAGPTIDLDSHENTFVGYYAGYNLDGACDNNIVIGNSGPAASTILNDRLWIDTHQTDTPLIGGNFATHVVTITGDLVVTGSGGGGVTAHSDLTELDYASAGHTGFQPTLSANQIIDHTVVTLTAGVGLSGGGDISANRTFTFDATELEAITWGGGAQASIVHTFNVAGTDTTMTYGNGIITASCPLNATTGFQIGTVAALGTILRGNGTNFLASTFTIPDTMAINTLLYASAANVISALATGNSGVLVTSAGGVPSISTTLPNGLTFGTLAADWDIGDTRHLITDTIMARDAAGLELFEDGGKGLTIEDSTSWVVNTGLGYKQVSDDTNGLIMRSHPATVNNVSRSLDLFTNADINNSSQLSYSLSAVAGWVHTTLTGAFLLSKKNGTGISRPLYIAAGNLATSMDPPTLTIATDYKVGILNKSPVGVLDVTGLAAVSQLHVGGTSDPGDNNVIIDGTAIIMGNIGHGITDIESWAANYIVMQMGGASAIFATNTVAAGGTLVLTHNAYYSDAWRYTLADEACLYYMNNGAHYWRVAGVGVKDAVITWISAFTIGSTGGVHVGGTTDPGDNNFVVDGTSTLTGIVSANNVYPITDNTYYLGKNDDDTPFAWKGLIVKDTTNGKYYRIEVINGAITATDLTD